MSSQPIRVDLIEDLEARDEERAGRETPGTAPVEPEQAASAEIHLDHLRRILLGYDDARLDSLQGWLNDESYRASAVSEILPRAIRLREVGDQELGEALGPTIESAFADFVRRDPEAAARVLAPVMGSAIWGAVREALAPPLRVLRLAATAPGLRWLVEARRSGVSFSDVADRNTLVFRVEYVLLFHRATGAMLVEVENPRARAMSREQLAATVDRVRAILGMAREEPEGEQDVPASDLGIVMEQGERLVAIALVRGNAPERLRSRLTSTLDAIHLERRLSLKTFAGDPAPFELCRPLLEKLLDSEYSEPHANKALWLSAAGMALVLGAVAWWLL